MKSVVRCSSWRWMFLALLGALAVVAFLSRGVIEQNVLAVQVVHAVMPTALPVPRERDYIQGTLNVLGLTPTQGGQPFQAKYFSGLEAIAPDTGAGHRLLGQYALLTVPPNLERAQAHLERAAKLSPDDSMAWLWLGRAAWLAGDCATAVTCWETSVGENYQIRLWLAQGIFGTGQVHLAVRSAVRLLYLPRITEAQMVGVFETLRWWPWWGGQTNEDAIRICDEILGPTDGGQTQHAQMRPAANLFARRALALQEAGRLAEARRDLDRALEIGDTPYVEVVRASLLAAEGDGDQASHVLQEVLTDTMTDAHAWVEAGKILIGLGYPAEARQAWQNAARLSPNYESSVQSLLEQYP